jgi:hypothetical protein
LRPSGLPIFWLVLGLAALAAVAWYAPELTRAADALGVPESLASLVDALRE